MSRKKSNLLIVVLFIIISCKEKIISDKQYSITSIDQKINKECENCIDKSYKTYKFNITHKSVKKTELNKLKMSIYLGDKTIYYGSFRNSFIVDSICFCNLYKNQFLVTIQVNLFDNKNKLEYYFGAKNPYDLQYINEINIKLLSTVNYWGDRYIIKLKK